MPNPGITESYARKLVAAVQGVIDEGGYYYRDRDDHGQKSAIEEAARRLDMNSTTLNHNLRSIERRWGWTPDDFTPPKPDLDLEELGDGLEILQQNAPHNAAYIGKFHSKPRLRIVKKEPFAIAFVGDPHLDNKGCDIDRLMSDLAILRASNIRAINIGDICDFFHKTGKLAKKQASNRMNPKDSLAAARWFVREGALWDAHILGNHDGWAEEEFAAMLKGWAAETGAKVHDWECEITYSWGDGEFKVSAAHDFKGHSKYNALHGPMNRALEDGGADLYVAGHRHNAAEANVENGWRGRRYWFLRVMGYKVADDYAKAKQFPQQKEGHSAIAVIDPWSETMTGRCQTFLNLAEGVEELQKLRARETCDLASQ